MIQTRRLVPILAADVVGYSRLMGEDEAGTARAVREHRDAARPIMASLGGRIVKSTGDRAAKFCCATTARSINERAPRAGDPQDHPRGLFPQLGC